MIANQAVALGPSAHAVALGLLDARGMALDADAERDREVERLLVGEAELLGELVHPDLACHVRVQPFVVVWSVRVPAATSTPADKSRTFDCAHSKSTWASIPGARSARPNALRRTASARQ
jgi:hypothetical protein